MTRSSSINVASLRKHIDALDAKLVSMLNERARLAVRVGHLKRVRGTAIYDPGRERNVLARIANVNKGPLPDAALCAIYGEIMATALALECDFKIAVPRESSNVALRAARRCFGGRISHVVCKDVAETCRAVVAGRAKYGFVPAKLVLSPTGGNALRKAWASGLKVCAVISMGQSMGDICVLISTQSAGSAGEKTVMLVEMNKRGNIADAVIRDLLRNKQTTVVVRRGNSMLVKSKSPLRSAGARNLERRLKRNGFAVTVLGSCPA